MTVIQSHPGDVNSHIVGDGGHTSTESLFVKTDGRGWFRLSSWTVFSERNCTVVKRERQIIVP